MAELEQKLTRWYGLPHALAVSNATSGLLGIALALDLQGAEFITTPYTWGGSLAAWLMLGCRPVFADIDPRTLTIDPASVAARITPRTRAILAVDIDGTPCDSSALRKIADDHGLWYVADAAQSLGGTLRGRPASIDADALVVSFSAGKTLDVSEGGAVVTRHTWLHKRLIWHTQHPQRQARDLGLGLTNELAINARIHPASAAAANTLFDQALAEVGRRQERSFAILRALDRSNLIAAMDPPISDECRPAFYRLSVPVVRRAGDDPEESLERYLGSSGFRVKVERSPVTLIYRMPAFLQTEALAPCPIAEQQTQCRVVIRQVPLSR